MKRALFLCGALAWVSPLAVAVDTKICIEAEKPVFLQTPFKKGSDQKGAVSGGGFLEVPWDRSKSAGGKAIYKFTVKKPGVYVLWARTFWFKGCGNSIKVSISKGWDRILGEDDTYDTWHWVGGKARFTLKAGVNTLTLKNNETGLRVDQFCLWPDEE